MNATATRTIYLSLTNGPYEAAEHFTLTNNNLTNTVRVVRTVNNTTTHDVTVALNTVKRSLLRSAGILRVGRYNVPVAPEQADTILGWF